MGAGVGLALAFAASVASAATCGTSSGLDTTNVIITSIDSSPASIAASDCAGVFAGNDTGNQGTLLSNLNSGIFAGFIGDWSIYGKSDEDASVSASETNNGSWSIDYLTKSYSVFALSLKAANGYAVYLFDLSPGSAMDLAGTFKTLGFQAGNSPNSPDLSHMTVAVYGDGVSAVPLPAAGWLMLAGIGGLAALRRRKRS